MNESKFTSSIEVSVKLIKKGEFKNIKDFILNALRNILDKYKEFKEYEVDIVQNQTDEKHSPFYETVFDFNEVITILTNKSFGNKRFTDKELNSIHLFIDNYFKDDVFANDVVDFGKEFVGQLQKKGVLDSIRLEAINSYFIIFPQMMASLKLAFDFLFKFFELSFEIKLSDDNITEIIKILHHEITKMHPHLKEVTILKKRVENEIETLDLKHHVTEKHIDAYFEKWFKNIVSKNIISQEKILHLIKNRKPRFNFSYETNFYEGPLKGLVNFFKKIFGKPIATLTITGYKGSEFEATLNDESYSDNYEKCGIIEFFNIAKDSGNLFSMTENLFNRLSITSEVFKNKSLEKINLFKNFATLDNKICDFFFDFFVETKKTGIKTWKTRLQRFHDTVVKALDSYKAVIQEPLYNYYTAHKMELKIEPAEIEMFLKNISVDLSGLFLTLSRLEKI